MSYLPTITTDTFDTLIKKLQKNTIINISGSLIYIVLKFIFYTALFGLVDKTMYGSMGYFFSYIFLMVNIATAPTLYMPAHMMSSNKNRTKSFLSLIVLHLLLLVGSMIFFVIHVQTIPTVQELLRLYPALLFISAAIIIFEGLRLLLRFCMHMINKTYIIVPLELASMVIYMAIVFYFLAFDSAFSLYHIFIPFLIDSIIITTYFAFSFSSWIKQNQHIQCIDKDLPNQPKLFLDSLAHALSFYAQALLSDNMIIVSFMPSLGLSQIALPKFAAYIAESFRILVRSLVKFSMIPALVMIQQESKNQSNLQTKKEFIAYAKNKFLHILLISIGIITLVGITSYLFPHIYQNNTTFISSSMFLISIFLIAKYIDQWNFFYEKIILSEEKPWPIIIIALIKILTAIILYINHISLEVTLVFLVCIKIATALFSYFYAQYLVD